jgi:hypothetical protein
MIEVHPRRALQATVGALYLAATDDFETAPADSLMLDFDGIQGDLHASTIRKSTSREPWYTRGIDIRNERQVTLVCATELTGIADDMGIDHIDPAWIGANIVLTGVADLSSLPASTLLYFDGGATIKIDFQNGPCCASGARIARGYPDKDATSLALDFVTAAKRRRGLLAWVEKPGVISVGEAVKVQLPDQWIYPHA